MNPKSTTLRFCFHDLVGIEVVTDHPQVESFFVAEYRYHQVEHLPAVIPCIHLDFRLQRFPLWVAPSAFTHHVHKVLARWAYRISISEDRIDINVIGNRWAIPMVHHMMVHPSLRYLSTKQGVLLLHSGSVAYEHKSLIFTGKGGTGKTTTTSLILAFGDLDWAGHSDDYTFLAAGPESWSYQTRSHLYRDLLRWVPELSGRLSLSERIRLVVFGFLRTMTKGKLLWPVRLPFDRLWPGKTIQTRAKLAAVILLERAPIQSPHLKLLGPDEAQLDDLISMNFWEARHFLGLIHRADVLQDFDSWLSAWRQAEYNLLSQRLKETPVYVLELPLEVGAKSELKKNLTEALDPLIS